MRKFIVAVLLIVALALAGLAYSYYSEYAMASNVARYYRSHPDEVPKSESREQYGADALLVADRNRDLATLSGTGSLLLGVGGAALFMLGRRKDAFSASPGGGLNEVSVQRSEEMNRWASATLASPVKVQFRRRYAVLYVCIMNFFLGVSALVIVVNGFTGATLFMLIINGMLLFMLYYIQRRAQRRAAYFFDLFGVTRGDGRRLNWSEFKSVDYLMARRTHSRGEFLWRVELTFNGGEAWIIPQRVENLDEINSLIASIPGQRHRRRA